MKGRARECVYYYNLNCSLLSTKRVVSVSVSVWYPVRRMEGCDFLNCRRQLTPGTSYTRDGNEPKWSEGRKVGRRGAC